MKSYLNRIISLWVPITILFVLANLVFAGPTIKIDTPNVDIGSIREGEVKRVRHVFTVRNTGDKDLIINRVKPG